MRLQRVMEHLRKQDWAAVAIDFVITVVGVFVGLQAANLNEDRIERQRAHGYLERIHADLDVDLATYRDRLAFWSAVIAVSTSRMETRFSLYSFDTVL